MRVQKREYNFLQLRSGFSLYKFYLRVFNHIRKRVIFNINFQCDDYA